MSSKILIIQLKQIGDVLMTTPTVRALHHDQTEWEIHYLTQKPANQIFDYSPYIKKLIIHHPHANLRQTFTLIKKLRAEHYDVIIDFLGSPRTAIISYLTGAKVRVGFNLRVRRWFYTNAVEVNQDVHYSADKKLSLLKPLHVDGELTKIDFFISGQDRQKSQEILKQLGVKKDRPLVSISPVSRRNYKVWPAQNFALICDFLVEKYQAQILFLWGPGEYHFIKAVKEKMKHSTLADYDIPTIRETVALLEMVDLHIGNDNGPMHFAISASKPTIAIFGRPNPLNWTPYHAKKHLYVEYDPGCKKGCYYPKCGLECINDLKVEKVIEAIKRHQHQINHPVTITSV
jgi:ADP-heptose:LPS heptosyltransferase